MIQDGNSDLHKGVRIPNICLGWLVVNLFHSFVVQAVQYQVASRFVVVAGLIYIPTVYNDFSCPHALTSAYRVFSRW